MRRVLSVIAAAAVAGGAVVAATPAQAATGGIIIYKVQYNAPGTDTGSLSSVNQEYLVLKNTSSTVRYASGWVISDKENHRYTLPYTKISPGKVDYVRTGKGTNNWYTRYWGSRYYVWNNDGDKAYLRSPSGRLLDSCSWGSTGSSTSC
jgi:hypothetical protein